MAEQTSFTPEDIERMEHEILNWSVHNTTTTSKPLTLPIKGLSTPNIMTIHKQMVAERDAKLHNALIRRQMDAGMVMPPLTPIEPKMVSVCPLCGKQSPEDKTCTVCLDKYTAESEEWLKKNAQ